MTCKEDPVHPMHRIALATVVAAGLGISNSGCGPLDGPIPGPSGPSLVVHSGDQQVGMTGSVVNISVQLSGASTIDDQTITWIVRSGGGSVTSTSQTDRAGIASIAWTLGPSGGWQHLEAIYAISTSSPASGTASALAVSNPACADGILGPHGALTWTPDSGALVFPDGSTIYGTVPTATPLQILPGTRVCLGPGASLFFVNGGYLEAHGTAQFPIIITALDVTQPWGRLDFAGDPASPSRLNHVLAEYGSHGFYGADGQHPVIITNSTVTNMAQQGLYLTAAGSSFVNSTVSSVSWVGAELGIPSAGGSIIFSGRVTGTGASGINVSGPGVQLSNCEVTANAGDGIQVAGGGLPLAIHGCNIHSNGGPEISSLDSTGIVDATGNWWGAAGGPAAGELVGQVTAGSPLGAPVSLNYLR